jgi:signal transduction histidine kinase/ligand-binding sensor domain-containing protein/CheY-like chemotaxis protein/HPt (histidine-containing phosphotransfer) domain-containing protein
MSFLRACAVIGAILCVLLPQLAAAAPARTLRFEQLSTEHGLSQESVLAVVQDSEGFMWFGTQAGLSRFDGYRVTVFKNNVNDPRSMSDNWVRVLHVDRKGRMWVGTDGGLDLFEPATRTFRHFQPKEVAKRGSGNRHIRAVIDDGKGGLWLGTSDGLQHFDPETGQFVFYHRDPSDPSSLSGDHVNALVLDRAGRLWIGTNAGLDMLAPNASGFVHQALHGDEPGRASSVNALMLDLDQVLWIGKQAGLESRRLSGPANPRIFGEREGLKAGPVTVLYQDVDKNVWVGTHTDGLYRWQADSGHFARYRHQPTDPHSVADNQISALYRDRVGTFWVGTWYAGVSRVDLASGGFARIVRQPDQHNTLLNNKIRSVIEAGHGKLWVGTNEGLNLLDPSTGEATAVPHSAFLQDASVDRAVSAVVMDRHGALYIGSRLGVSSYHPKTGKARKLPSLGNADSNEVRNLYIDRSGMLWIASRGGLHRLDPATNEVTSYRHDLANPTSLSDNIVRPVLEDRRGQLWAGTFNGLELLDRETGKFRHFHHDPKDPSSLSHDEVHYIMEDSQGSLWVGTAAGLNKMVVGEDGSVRFQRITTKDGLADDAVASILEDERGLLWISTNTGIARIEPKSGRVRNYSAADGTIEGAYFDCSAVRASDGTLYFGGFNGITGFQPRAINDNLIAPRAIITGFQIFNKPVEQIRPGLLSGPVEATPELSLAATDSVFSLEFSALHYASPSHNRFSYQLEGFDEAWVQADASKRFATYTNLDPGTYVFRVKASNKDGVWGATAAAMTIHVLPPYWKTWWFRSLVLLLALGVIYGAYRFRIIGLRRAKSVLEAQVRARVEEIEQKNHQLERQAQELQARREEAEKQRAEAERRQADAEGQKVAVELAHRNISTLSEIGREMTATLDMETIMGTVYRHVHHLMDARIFGIGLYNEATREIEFPFSIDQGVRNQYYTRSLDNPNQFAVWCLVNRKNVFINNLEEQHAEYIEEHSDANMYRALRIDGSNPSQVRAMMYVPLVVKDKMLGVMCVQSTETDAYRRVHLDMLQTLAAYAAVALDNARAYQELEDTQRLLLEQEKQVRLHTEELALANRALQENDERLRHAKQKAEDATRQKSEFLANMSHEMRTPLAGVIGMLSFALRDVLLQDSTREQMLRAQANAQALLAIINDLLDFSKIEAGKLTIENIDFDLNASVQNVSALFEEQAGANSVDFDIVLDPTLPRFVVGDPTRLRQVLVNLVGNAFKFTNDGMVRLKVDRMPGGENYSMVRFSVQDTGIGIAPDALARLFQKFEQADSTTTRRYGGTGLGLAICRQLVELMGGEIWVDSRLGEGSTFTFQLPLADGVEPQIVQHMPRQPHTHRLRVLCAEDFPTNQIIVRMLLEEMGHRVDIAENGALAVAACVQARYDLILMDGRMPEMDGATATRIIRSGGNEGAPVRDQELMIIALTANASEEDRNRYLAAGMDDFLTKPIDENALHFQISKAIERQLQRGFELPLMSEPLPGAAPSTSELDAMFGVVTGPTPLAVAAAQNAGRRASDLKARMRTAFSNDLPNRRADLDAAIASRDHEAAGRLLHGIKGSAAYLDATELHLLCGELELAADGQEWGIITASMARLNRLLGEFETSNQE